VNVRRSRFLTGSVAALVVLVAVGCVRPDPPPPDARVSAKTLQPLPGHRYAQANDINEKGEAVGWSIVDGRGSGYKAVLWRDGRAIDLRPGAAATSMGHMVNERSQVVLTEVGGGLVNRAYLWDHGQVTDLSGGAPWSTALDLNDNGQVLVKRTWSSIVTPSPKYNYELWSNGTFTPLVENASTVALTSLALLNDGTVVGNGLSGVFRWKDGVFTAIPQSGRVMGANQRGEVLISLTGTGSGTVIWRDGRFDPVTAPAGHSFYALDISEDGHVTGRLEGDDGNTAVVWKDGEFTTLEGDALPSLVNNQGIVIGSKPGAPNTGQYQEVVWVDGRAIDVGLVTYVHDLNNRGQFVGTFGDNTSSGDGVQGDAVLWTVLP
jgi:uncharacterized membrane protein